MEYTIVGVGQRRSGMSKKTGSNYDFTTLYALSNDPDVDGHKAEELSINHIGRLQWPLVSVGDRLNVEHNSGGYVVSVTKLPPDPFNETPAKKT